jgi:hypothetical protein
VLRLTIGKAIANTTIPAITIVETKPIVVHNKPSIELSYD